MAWEVEKRAISKMLTRTSQVVQWLSLPAPSAGSQVQCLVEELDPTC